MTTVFDPAEFFRLKAGGAIEQMQLQKLLYYSQGWSLANKLGPLFPERIEAWVNGPVVPQLWEQQRNNYLVRTISGADTQRISVPHAALLDKIWQSYGKYTGVALSRLTHTEPPWLDARRGLPEGMRSNREITQESLREFFSSQLTSTLARASTVH